MKIKTILYLLMNNHKYFCALTVAMIAGTGCCVPARAQQKTSLRWLYDLADQQNQRIKVSEAALMAAEEGVAAAKSAWLPNVEFSLQGSYTGNAVLMSRGFSTSGTTEYIVPGLGPQQVQNGKQTTPHWGNSFTAQASQVIYAGGAISSGIEMAEIGRKLAELDVEKNRQEVRLLLAGYYLDLCKLGNQLQVIDKNIELAEKVIEQMRARREQGTVLKNDITRYELQLQNLMLAKVQISNAQTIIRHQICSAVHLPDGEQFELDTLSLSEEETAIKALASEQHWQQTASENNIAIRQASLAAEISDLKIQNTRAASLPSLALVAENHLFGPYTNDLIPKDANVNVWFVGIGLKYSLSSLWKNNHALSKSKCENSQAFENVQLAREGIENGIQACYTNLLTSSAEVSTLGKQAELANLNYSVVKNRYDNDLALLTDMIDASNTKLSADMALVNARINMIYNYYKLKYTTNTL